MFKIKKFLTLMLVIAMVLGIVGDIPVYADGNKREVNLEQAGSCVYLGNNEKIGKNIELSICQVLKLVENQD